MTIKVTVSPNGDITEKQLRGYNPFPVLPNSPIVEFTPVPTAKTYTQQVEESMQERKNLREGRATQDPTVPAQQPLFTYGQWCGAGWSNGQLQSSVYTGAPPEDPLDHCCYSHDSAFALDMDARRANSMFFDCSRQHGVRGTIYGLAVAMSAPGQPRFRGSRLTPGGNSASYIGDYRTAVDIPKEYTDTLNMPPKQSKKATRPTKRKQLRANNVLVSPVSTISTAPVSIGNSIRGSSPMVTQIKNGHRVIGRDFAFTSGATVAAATNWSLVGGMPITPAACPSTILRNYTQMYAHFKVNAITFHYITSSPTSQSGDVLFYYEQDRESPMTDITNNSFIPFVVSDPNTILGPQWTNHSMQVKPATGIMSTGYGLGTDITSEAAGSIFLFSKTTSASSPGYILFDYDISFFDLSINPRAGLLPVSRAQWTMLTIGRTTTAVVSATTLVDAAIQGINQDGSASALPTGATNGDIYKMIVLPTNSTVSGTNATWTNCTTSNLFMYHTSGSNGSTLTLDDGVTLYAVYAQSAIYLYQNYANATTDSNRLYYGVTATITYNLCTYISLLSSNSSFLQSSQ